MTNAAAHAPATHTAPTGRNEPIGQGRYERPAATYRR